MAEQVVSNELAIEDVFTQLGLIDVDPKSVTSDVVISGFLKAWEKDDGDLETLKDLRTKALCHVMASQMKRQRYFEIVTPKDAPEKCPSCNGAGFIAKFLKKQVEVNCHICAGKGKLKSTCPHCKGSGRHIKRWKKGGGMNLVCTVCEGQGKIMAQCSNCITFKPDPENPGKKIAVSNGKLEKTVLDHTIKSTTPCKHCQSLGFKIPAPKQAEPARKEKPKHVTPQIGNPVISTSDAAALSDMIKQN